MTTRLSLIVITIFLSHPVHSEPKKVPKNLFGFELGSAYEIKGFDFRAGNLPVRKFAGFRNPVFGSGMLYFFQPNKDYDEFEYYEKNKSQDNEHFESSFYLVLLPKLSPNIKTTQQLTVATIPWEVATVGWGGRMRSAEAYSWARTLCSTFTVDLGQRPEIEDRSQHNVYRCVFSEHDRVFEISAVMGGHLSLSYNDAIRSKKDKSITTRLREIHANEIRPYENEK